MQERQMYTSVAKWAACVAFFWCVCVSVVVARREFGDLDFGCVLGGTRATCYTKHTRAHMKCALATEARSADDDVCARRYIGGMGGGGGNYKL